MDPYKARQDVTEKMLLEVLAAQSHNGDICDSKTEISKMSRRCSVCPTAKDRQTMETWPVLRMGVQGPLYQDSSNNM
jgi:hypothetical protein